MLWEEAAVLLSEQWGPGWLVAGQLSGLCGSVQWTRIPATVLDSDQRAASMSGSIYLDDACFRSIRARNGGMGSTGGREVVLPGDEGSSDAGLFQCLWCNENKACLDYPVRKVLPPASLCKLSSARWGVCWGKLFSFYFLQNQWVLVILGLVLNQHKLLGSYVL